MHVAVLERADLVIKQRRGREQLVRCNVDTVRRAQHLLDQLESVWRDRLDRFEQLLDDDGPPAPSEADAVNHDRDRCSQGPGRPHDGDRLAITQMTIHSTFRTFEAMEQTLAMGAEEGMTLALGQIDDLLSVQSM